MKTCAADIHKDHIEVEVIQWDEYDQIETVQQYTFKGNTDSIHLTPWDQLTKCVENRVDITFIDAGYLTKQVYLFTGQYSSGVYPIKGFHGLEGDGYWCKPKDSNNEFTIHINVKEYRAIRGYKNYQDLRLYSIAALEYFNQNQKGDQ